jgi:hypothetical protein
MPGLFVSCEPELTKPNPDTVRLMIEVAYRVRREQAVVVNRPGCCLGVSHHGILRSGGTSWTNDSSVAALGLYPASCSSELTGSKERIPLLLGEIIVLDTGTRKPARYCWKQKRLARTQSTMRVNQGDSWRRQRSSPCLQLE